MVKRTLHCRTETTTRIWHIMGGRSLAVPDVTTVFAKLNLVTKVETIFGRFENPEQAVYFGLTGIIKRHVTLQDVLNRPRSNRKDVWVQTRCMHLNDEQVRVLLDQHRLPFSTNLERYEYLLRQADAEPVIAVEKVETQAIDTVESMSDEEMHSILEELGVSVIVEALTSETPEASDSEILRGQDVFDNRYYQPNKAS